MPAELGELVAEGGGVSKAFKELSGVRDRACTDSVPHMIEARDHTRIGLVPSGIRRKRLPAVGQIVNCVDDLPTDDLLSCRRFSDHG
ncbi:hypothetical protein D3C87_1731900 [compost metagenome]